MSDSPSILPSPTGKHTSPISSLFTAPKLFMGFSSKGFSDSEAAMSPTSILETKPFSVIGNPFFAERHHRRTYWGNGDSTAIGLGLVDALTKEKSGKRCVNPSSRMILFGSLLKIQIPPVQSNSTSQTELKIQIPPVQSNSTSQTEHKIQIPPVQPNSISPTGSVESPPTPIEFGVKNKNSQLGLHTPLCLSTETRPSSPRLLTGCLSPSEMELSEDYTCVISYGPNPKKTHIFDNYVMESCGDGFVASKKERSFFAEQSSPSEDFLSFCHACNKSLAQGNDIFMYRGERAFCSAECRQEEMMSDDEGT